VSDGEKRGLEDPASVETEPTALRSQLGALFILLPVFGVIWVLFRYLPAAGDWIGEKTDQVMERVETPGEVSEIPASEPAELSGIAAGTPVTVKSGDLVSFRQQILEQLSSAGRVEVRHLALSDDETRMVAALQLTEESGESRLVEVFFERDEFGRYLSTDDSPIGISLKLWSE
jgi:hypothetical protein